MSIELWRSQIDSIDNELLRLLNTRASLAIKVGESKLSAGMSLSDQGREREVLERLCETNTGPLDAQAVLRLFRRIICESRRVEARELEGSGE
ncbi:MAG TPA: chorismate mutase [Pyrinomonadaceae bacterium]|nr:chorismate mutase [Pyrinomonadaceae bacterium]